MLSNKIKDSCFYRILQRRDAGGESLVNRFDNDEMFKVVHEEEDCRKTLSQGNAECWGVELGILNYMSMLLVIEIHK